MTSPQSKRQRLEAIIAGEAPDRPPVALWRHWPGDDQDAGALAAAHLRWQRDYDWDLVKVSPASSFCLVDYGVEDRWEGHMEGTRSYTRRMVAETADWPNLPDLDPEEGMLAVQLEALRQVGQGLKLLDDPPPFIATIFSPLAQAKNLAGGSTMLHHLRSDPAAFHRGLETITDNTIRFIEAAKEVGISGIYYAVQHARYPLLNPAEFDTFSRPYDEEVLAAVSDLWLNILHVHGREIMFTPITDYPVQIVNWHDRDSGFSLKEGLEEVDGAVSGGVSRWTLQRGSPAEIEAEAQDALQQTGGQRLLLGTGCVAMTNSPLRNIRALREAVF